MISPDGFAIRPRSPGELTNLLLGTSRARIGHDENRIERRPDDFLAVLVLAEDLGREPFDHRAADLILNFGPDVDDLVVALAVGDDAVVVLLLNFRDLLLRLVEQMRLLRRNLHVLDRDGNSRAGGELVAHVLHAIGENNRRLVAALAVNEVDQVAEFLLLHGAVDFRKRNLGRHDLIEQDAADRGLDPLELRRAVAVPSASAAWRLLRFGARLAVGLLGMLGFFARDIVDAGNSVHPHRRHPHVDLRVQADLAMVIGDAHFVGVGEKFSLAQRQRTLARHVVKPQHHVLGRHDNRLAVRR